MGCPIIDLSQTLDPSNEDSCWHSGEEQHFGGSWAFLGLKGLKLGESWNGSEFWHILIAYDRDIVINLAVVIIIFGTHHKMSRFDLSRSTTEQVKSGRSMNWRPHGVAPNHLTPLGNWSVHVTHSQRPWVFGGGTHHGIDNHWYTYIMYKYL